MHGDDRPDDERLMGLALALGRRHLGLTWPNPSVGAVVVDPSDGRIVSTGVTQKGGRPHGEPIALTAAGAAARGATLFVALEPCSHHGRSPPCTDAVMAAGIARVVSAMPDPDPRVAGTGHARLREAGIAVREGVRASEARRDHRGHVTRGTLGRPTVTVKLAQTADGYAGVPGRRLMITGPESNARTHLMRAHADAILVGVSTVLADDPRLDVRLPGLESRNPVRVVLDSRLRVPPAARVVATARTQPTWILCGDTVPGDRATGLEDAGVIVIRTPLDATGRIELAVALGILAERGLTRILCEGGPTLADGLAAADLLDEAVLITGEDALLGPGTPAVGPRFADRLAQFTPATDVRIGPDRLRSFERP